jgi:hypothetical protein
LKSAEPDLSACLRLKRDVLPKLADRSDFPLRYCELRHRSRAVEIPDFQTRAIFAQLNDRYRYCLAVQPGRSSKLRWQTQQSHRRKQTQILCSWLDLCLDALSRLIGSKAGVVRRHRNGLRHELPDRDDRTQNEECVNCYFEKASILVFRLRLHDKIVSCRFMGVHRLPCPYAPAMPRIFIVK